MRITKFVHSCFLVETPERIGLFNPGVYSAEALDLDAISKLDDILITHVHVDHFSPELVQKILQKFPDVRITSTPDVVEALSKLGITAIDQPSEGIELFEAPHESIDPFDVTPFNYGINYLGLLTDPGDSHSFTQTKEILALPVQAPWGATIRAINLAMELKPKYVLPIHDWHWNDKARGWVYEKYEDKLAEKGIKFIKLETGVPVEIDI